MWNIYEVKQSARAKLSLSYWKSVLVALILAVVTGAGEMQAQPPARRHRSTIREHPPGSSMQETVPSAITGISSSR